MDCKQLYNGNCPDLHAVGLKSPPIEDVRCCSCPWARADHDVFASLIRETPGLGQASTTIDGGVGSITTRTADILLTHNRGKIIFQIDQ